MKRNLMTGKTILLSLLIAADPSVARGQSQSTDSYPGWTAAQKYVADGFHPVDCFGGQAKVRGRRVQEQPYSVFRPNAQRKCCGDFVRNAQTDKHGHFVVEPMNEGEYFVQFDFNGVRYTTDFAVTQTYDRCEANHVEINFSDANRATLNTFVDIDDSSEPCKPSEPRCFRK